MIKTEKYSNILAYIISFVFILAGVLVSLNRFWQYEVFYYDFGIFDQAIWNVSRLKPPIIDHLAVGGKWIFADHFSPSIFLLSPLYWLTDRQEMLLVAQAVVVGLSGIVLYWIGKKALKSAALAFSILICYFLFVGLQNAVISDFHETTIMTLFLMLIFWAIIFKKTKLYFTFLLITLGFKESTFLLGAGIGVAVIFLRKDWFKIAVATIAISLIWGYVSIKLVIPLFSNGIYLYAPSFNGGLIDNIFAFIDNPLKQRTLFFSFLSFSFLPLIYPPFWFLILQDYGIRFIPQFCCTRWGLGLHYNAQSAVILAVASIFALKKLKTIKFTSRFLHFSLIIVIFIAFFLYRFILHGPFALAYNPSFYEHTKDFVFLDTMVAKIPKSAVVMTQNNLATRFTHQKVYLLKHDYKTINPDYILIDNRKGQNANNYFGGSTIESVLAMLKKDKRYTIIYNTDDQKIFKKYNFLHE